MSQAIASSSKKTTSTLLDGRHAYPPFYACYLLQSLSRPGKTYIGSTPNPPKRIRQHNGDLSQGAFKTSRARPWGMQMLVYGFPSKLSALQFEWACQHPHITRHLKIRDSQGNETSMFGRGKSRGDGLQRQVMIFRILVSVLPFSRLPLHVRIFTDAAREAFEVARDTHALGQARKSRGVLTPAYELPPVPASIQVTVDPGGVLGLLPRPGNIPGLTTPDGPIEVDDREFRQGPRVKHKWDTLKETKSDLTCRICRGKIDPEDHLSFSVCPSAEDPSCHCITHLACLASKQEAILPKSVQCPQCGSSSEWGEVIRSCYGRREEEGRNSKQSTRKRTTKTMKVRSQVDQASRQLQEAEA